MRRKEEGREMRGEERTAGEQWTEEGGETQEAELDSDRMIREDLSPESDEGGEHNRCRGVIHGSDVALHRKRPAPGNTKRRPQRRTNVATSRVTEATHHAVTPRGRRPEKTWPPAERTANSRLNLPDADVQRSALGAPPEPKHRGQEGCLKGTDAEHRPDLRNTWPPLYGHRRHPRPVGPGAKGPSQSVPQCPEEWGPRHFSIDAVGPRDV
ncbi:unnamed protein product [Gadus morhua 'NCC']